MVHRQSSRPPVPCPTTRKQEFSLSSGRGGRNLLIPSRDLEFPDLSLCADLLDKVSRDFEMPITLRIAGIAGNLGRPFRTRTLVDRGTARAAARFSAIATDHDLSDLQPARGAAPPLEDLDGLPRTIIKQILSAHALVVGSPVYKGCYTGLFKHLFDLIDPAALAGKPVLLIATGGGVKHALVIEHQLRPFLGFFETVSLPTRIYASGADFSEIRLRAPRFLPALTARW
ncbi:NAD(P)H-dependent oxidoreductase [uncultured Paracoccus sp.]|uniref:NAD(P)H-dependent oxidoreductase n=2 Tax=uncultured Paracoccus sp. TaxID=189685 RepID=UPI00260C07F6|nr:NAD(P)H-dependent oxidoreductase [uncultured Paracoccus sp.]